MPFTKIQSKLDFVKFDLWQFLTGSPDSGHEFFFAIYSDVRTNLPFTNVPSVRF